MQPALRLSKSTLFVDHFQELIKGVAVVSVADIKAPVHYQGVANRERVDVFKLWYNAQPKPRFALEVGIDDNRFANN